MTRAHKGNYSAKHPPGTQVPTPLADAVSRKMQQGQLSCAAAFDIAGRLGLPPLEVGTAVDLQEGRLAACQLGLFGYGAKDKRVSKADQVPDALAQDIRQALTDGGLRCADAWRIAADRKMQRIEVSQACEALKIRISHCQLGAF